MTRRKKDDGVHLPAARPEDDYPDGDGPAWISEALGAPGCLADVVRYLSDDGEETALVLRFTNGREQIFRPARLVTTRRLTETLGALGFPVPYYQPPQLALLGQAIGRVADRATAQEEESSCADLCSLVGSWAVACLRSEASFVLCGRDGTDVRAAIEHIRSNVRGATAPLIVEPARGLLLAWTVPVRAVIRERLGTMSDGVIGLQLRRGGLVRERLAARPIGDRKRTHEMPVWALYNGWQGVELEMPDGDGVSGQLKLAPLESVGDLQHARARGRAHTTRSERSTTPNGGRRG
jgi:hypothetical protein